MTNIVHTFVNCITFKLHVCIKNLAVYILNTMISCIFAFLEKSAYEESVSDKVSADTVSSHKVPFHTPTHTVLIISPWRMSATGLVQQRGAAQDLLTRPSQDVVARHDQDVCISVPRVGNPV